MKLRTIAAAALLLAYIGCKQNTSNTNEEDHTTHTHHAEHEDEHEHTTENQELVLTLNDGQKWKADESTNFHTANLMKLSADFKAENQNSPEAAHAFADKIQDELNLLIKGCKMQGPAHDALHIWLKDVLDDVKQLKTVETEEDAGSAADKLMTDIGKYNDFFE
ncbi:MAG: hypothetical protein WDA08_10875 [Weeksellaceae bacterium]